MDQQAFDKIYEQMIIDEKECMRTKGEDYAHDSDRLANFKRIGKLANIEPKKVWLIYFYKHVDAIVSYISKGKSESESIEGRIMDVRNYLAIFRCMLEEEKQFNIIPQKDR